MPLVTVITAAYNSSRTLRVALESLRHQTFTDWEAWIVGDACTDDSGEVVASFGEERMHWVNLEHSFGGQWGPNNEGLRRAKSKYVAFLGHDDLWLPDHLKDLVQVTEESGADFAYSICGLFDSQGWVRCIGQPREGQTLETHHLPPSSWLHRRDLVDSVGYWRDPATLDVHMDMDFRRRVYRAGKKFVFCPVFSVVKIPSQWIGVYSLKGAPPQEAYWARIRIDLAGFEHDVLNAVAAEVAKKQCDCCPYDLWIAVRRVLGIIKRYMMRPLEKWRLQRHRAAIRFNRGLPPA
jgi:glycosyltransferase involved in cell wall biosynthesis